MANYDFTPTIPNAPNNPSADQPLMKINNQSTFDLIKEDHIGFRENDGGFHRQARIKDQVGPPVGRTADSGTLYVKNVQTSANPVGSERSLIYVPSNSANIYQMTNTIDAQYVSFANTAGGVNAGWTFLPGGLVLQYGALNTVGGIFVVNFPVEYAAPPFSITTGIQGTIGSPTCVITGALVNQFAGSITPGGSAITFLYWTAIGRVK